LPFRIITRYRPGDGETICLRRWHAVRRSVAYRYAANQAICDSPWIYVRLRTGPQSAHFWWLAVAKLQAASVSVAQAAALWDRQTDGRADRAIPKCPVGRLGIIMITGTVENKSSEAPTKMNRFIHGTSVRPSVRLSVPQRSCLGYRHAGCLQLSHRRPPEMCEND